MMSEADEIFKKIEYNKIIENEKTIQYEFENIYMDNEIRFDLNAKTIIKEYSNGESQEITLQELKAINLKCKELGWVKG